MHLRKAAYLGFKFQFYLKVFNVALHQVGTIVIAILLTPHDFALVGVAMVFVGFVASIADFGIGSALIQRPGESPRILAAGATLRLILSMILVAVLLILAPAVAVAYAEPSLTLVVSLLSLLVVLNFMGFVARVTLTKSLRFREVFIPEVVGGIATTLSTLALALLGFSYWSLVFGSLAGAALGAAALFLLSPWKPGWEFDPKAFRDLLAFGAPLVAGNILFFAFENVGVGVLGFINFPVLGYYLLALSWAVSIPLGLHATIDNVMFPVYSAMTQDRDRIKNAYVNSLKHLARGVVPLGAFFAVGASFFVLALVGEKWEPAVAPLRILGVAGILLVLSLTYHSVAVAIGRPREILTYNLVGVAVMIPASITGAMVSGAVGLAVATLLASAFLLCWASFRTRVLLGSLGSAYREILLKPTIASLSFVVAIAALTPIIRVDLSWFAAILVLAGGTYLGMMELMTNGRFLKETRKLATDVLRA